MSFCNLLYVPALFAIVLVFSPLQCNGAELDAVQQLEINIFNVLNDFPGATNYIKAFVAGECYQVGGMSTTYSGKLSKTVRGKTCQRWDSQHPHKHTYTDATKYPDDTLADAANQCRDPSGSNYTWCYTTDPNIRWQPCDVNKCETEFDSQICYGFNETSNDYKGFVKQTVGLKNCQHWNQQSPHKHSFTQSSMYPENDINKAENYCRDPEKYGVPWCYTTDSSLRWQVCPTARCLY